MPPSRTAQAKQTTINGSNGSLKPVQPRKTTTHTSTSTKGKLKSITKTRPGPTSPSTSAYQASPPSSGKGKITGQGDSSSPSKASGGIQSFFSRTAQRPSASQIQVASTARASTPVELLETISSDEDNASPVTLSKGSSTALAVRKRKFQLDGIKRSEPGDGLPQASQKFRKLDDRSRISASSALIEDERPWVDRFAPTSLDELAVHKRKVDDVRQWLETAFLARRNKALILKGPAGSGKTTTIKLVAKSLGLDLIEWSSPAGKDFADNPQSYSAQFEDFMIRSGKVSRLAFVADDDSFSDKPPDEGDGTVHRGKHFLLVEDFPNTYSTASSAVQSFRSTIAQHLASSPGRNSDPIPLVFVISETALSTNTAAADSFTTHRLLGPELCMHAYIDTIEFNPIAPTFLTKALDLLILKEARKSGRRTTPGKAVVRRLAEFGDIRSAASTLEFLCLRGDHTDIWSAKVAFTKPKKKFEPALTKAEEDAIRWISSRASSLNIFHSVGKVVYNKRKDPPAHVKVIDPPSWLTQHRRSQVPENDANDLVTEIGTETTTYIAALHENYLLSCSNSNSELALDSVCGSIENLSDSDLLCLDRFNSRNQHSTGTAMDSLRQDEIAFQLGVRGVLFSLPTNVKRIAPTSGDRRDAFRMFYPASAKLWKHRAETEAALENVMLALRSLRPPPAPALDAMRAHLYATTGVRPHGEAESEELRSMMTSLSHLPQNALLIECLSYLYTVLQVRDPNAPVLAQLRPVIRMAGFADNGADNDEAEDNEQQLTTTMVEQWATDRPDDAGPSRKQKTSNNDPAKRDRTFDARLPVEKEVASLVLEDDDIEDD